MQRFLRRIPDSRIPGLAVSRRRLREYPLHIMPFDQSDLGLHSHDFTELVYIRYGFGRHLHDDQEYPVHRGDCFVIAPGTPHGYASVQDLRIVNILFYPRILADHLHALWEIPGFRQFFSMEPVVRGETQFRYKLHLQAHHDAAVSALIGEILEEQTNDLPGSGVVRTGLFYKLVVLLSRSFGDNVSPGALDSFIHTSMDAVARAISYLESNYQMDITLGEIASHACMSPRHLSEVFRTSVGIGVFDYLLAFRINKARHLLWKTTKPVTHIALETGFNDPAYFSRAFRKAVGRSPLQFRKSASVVQKIGNHGRG